MSEKRANQGNTGALLGVVQLDTEEEEGVTLLALPDYFPPVSPLMRRIQRRVNIIHFHGGDPVMWKGRQTLPPVLFL